VELSSAGECFRICYNPENIKRPSQGLTDGAVADSGDRAETGRLLLAAGGTALQTLRRKRRFL